MDACALRMGSMRRRPSAFSLAELLVVIGIIAILIGLLMPAMLKSRQSALLVNCAAQQRQFAQAALIRANERGALPLSGEIIIPASTSGLGSLAPALGDSAKRLNSYQRSTSFAFREELTPIFDLLAMQMLRLPAPYTFGEVATFSKANKSDLERFTRCPAEDPSQLEGTTGYAINLWTPESGARDFHMIGSSTHYGYAINGLLCGYDFRGATPYHLAGRISRLHDSSKVLLLADADTLATGYGFWYDFTDGKGPDTLGSGAVGAKLDKLRHKGKMNVTFADGHTEAIVIDNPALQAVRLAE